MSYSNYNSYLANRAICCCRYPNGTGSATGAQSAQGATGATRATGAIGQQGPGGGATGAHNWPSRSHRPRRCFRVLWFIL